MVVTKDWERVRYVSSSTHRTEVMYHLFETGPAQPSEIAEAIGRPLPHVSRSLAELRDEELVDLLVPEETQKGRIYGLTPDGRDIIWEVYRRDQDISYRFVEREEFPYDALLTYLIEHADDALRGVVSYTRDDIVGYVHQKEVLKEYTEEQINQAMTDMANEIFSEDFDKLADTVGRLKYSVQGFDRITVLRLNLKDQQQVLVSLYATYPLNLPTFAEACLDRLP